MKEIDKYGLKHELNELLKSGKKIKLDFDCGNDEGHVAPFVDGQLLEYDDFYFNLEELIFEELNLPSTGEDTVTGTGYLTLEDNNIYIYYDLTSIAYEWSEEIDYEQPARYIEKNLKDQYLLLSSEYDNPIKVKEYLEAKEKKQEKIENIPTTNFLLSEQELGNRLRGNPEEELEKKQEIVTKTIPQNKVKIMIKPTTIKSIAIISIVISAIGIVLTLISGMYGFFGTDIIKWIFCIGAAYFGFKLSEYQLEPEDMQKVGKRMLLVPFLSIVLLFIGGFVGLGLSVVMFGFFWSLKSNYDNWQ
ncbi:hypothetical protein P1X15_24815 [Runella sp. MFBS21]|uniref:hypothetical protein n=1 Tax=Runella sp. MFBS21 TaxID=3034018 RepID=UPI0023FA0EC8|nr:hypothetical protein [Runella sp. MFBS21]MDF7820868.1 hypothetical protein [Runella sp. MFBS21]